MNRSTDELIRQLGYERDTRLLLIHADDAGLSHAENRATIDVLRRGLVNSYSIMVPCPWFDEIACFAMNNPQYDHGIHLTLTCEWNSYKFGPILGQRTVPSLTDDKGYFYQKRQQVVDNARIGEMKNELCAQIDRALAFGLRPSHLDSHMYTLGSDMQFLELYREIGRLYELPVMLNSKLISQVSGIEEHRLDLSGEITVDHMHLGNFTDFSKGKLRDYYIQALGNLPKGFNLMLIHPAYDDPEMKAITVDHPNFGAAWRQIDLEFFTSDLCEEILREQKIQMINWKDIKDFMYPD